ncbi:uncharacterized protein [Henckelia pumila]|uniref:uncharacterized protein n=1 Tax=Henckelia pumila TaxID=405737 RepID=UPI003C6E1943
MAASVVTASVICYREVLTTLKDNTYSKSFLDITMEIPYSGTAQRPPILDGSNYSIWKVRMRFYIKSIDEKAWQRMLQGWNPPRRTYGEGDFLLKPETEWNADETAASNMNNKALNATFTSLDSNIFSLVTNYFENLRMEESETIDDYERRLRKIENEAIDLGDFISNERLGVNESDLGDDSIAFLTKQFGNYLKRMRDYKKPGQKPKVLNASAIGKPLRICGPKQNTIPSKSQNHFQKEGKTLNISKKFESVKCHECTGFGHYANECPTRLRKGMYAFLSDDEDEERTEQGEEETQNALSVLVLQKKHNVITGVTTLGHNTDQKVLCLNASVSGDSNQEAGEVELYWDNAQKMYEELYNDWILRNKTNSALTKENSELKASVARLEVVLSKKDLELGKVKEELGRANATLAKYNSSMTKLDSILMMGKDDRAGLGFHNSKFEVGESSQTIFVKENNNSASVPVVIPKKKAIPLKTQAPVQRKKQRKRRQELSSVLPTLNQNTARKKNSEKKDKGKVTYGGGANGKIVGKETLNVEGLPKLQNLGHANFKALKKLSQYDAVRGMPNLTSEVPYMCGDCQKGKQTRMSHPVLQHCGTTRCLELLHMDLMGPMEVESCGGKRYSFVYVDDFSRIQLAKFDSKSDNCLFLGYALNSRAYRVFNLRTRTIMESINVVFDDYADLKGKTIECNIDDMLDTISSQTDSSVVNSVVPPEKSPSTTLSPTLNMNEQSTEEHDDFEDEIRDVGHDVPSKIQ